MNLENIGEGQIFKSYREFCKELELKVLGGNAKLSQMKEIERHIKLRNQGYKLIVEEIYIEPLPKEDGRVNNGGNISNTKYDELMDVIITNLLVNNGGEIEESYTYLMNDYLKFFTSEYKKLYNVGYKRYSEINSMSKGLVMTYQQKMNKVVNGCFLTTLNRLKRNKIITYEKKTVILGKNFKKTYADKEMLKKIKEYQNKVCVEMDTTHYIRNNNPTINKEFKIRVCKYLNISRYWNVLSFKLIDKDTEVVEEDYEELIRRFIKSTIENTQDKQSTNSQGDRYKPYSFTKFDENIDRLVKLIWRLPNGYISKYDEEQEQDRLLDELFNVPF